MKILLVEDDSATAAVLTKELAKHRYIVETAKDGKIALELAQAFPYDLLIVDIVIPELDGISLCRQLRDRSWQMPILLLSAKDSTADRVIGLGAGADDYVAKPYQISELIARIQALLRRSSSNLANILTWEKLQIDLEACQVTYRGQLLRLTPKEYSILELFLRHPQRIFSRSAILDHIWPSGEFPQEDAVSTQIKGLRQKLKAAGIPADLIETLYGLGYRLKSPPEDSSLRQVAPAEARSATEQTPTATLDPVHKQQAQADVLAIAQQVWKKFKQSLSSEMVVFQQAIAQIASGTLDRELQAAAKGLAHRLIGSLGSFGFPKGSEIARQIEKLLGLESLSASEAPQLEQLFAHLQEILADKPAATANADLKTGFRHLLLVDDDAALAEQIEMEAIAWGFDVKVVKDAAGARKAISGCLPDAIVLNLSLPNAAENGLSLLAEIALQNPRIPLLVLTEGHQLSERVEVVRLGGNVFLEKPISPEEILKSVIQELDRPQKAEAKILIVDDDPYLLGALSNLLVPWGFQVITLAEPQQFWHALKTSAPDLLILDIEMPNFSGIELCQVVRSDPRWSDLPVLFLSGHNDAALVHQVFAVGADDYVQKPIVGPELIARILNRLERTRILHRFAEIDELTGTTTRRKSIQYLERLLNLAQHQNQPLCLIILDLDHFKQINDRYGHEAGDRVLSLLGKSLKQFFRSEDIVARWGGEEFVLGLYGMTRDRGAKRLAEFLKTWRQQEFTNADRQTFQVTFSAGVVEYSQDGNSLQELYRAADAMLYQAKAMGRNRVLAKP